MDLTSTFIIKTFAGLEPVLAEELKALGAEDVVEIKRAVRCSGDQKLMYRANYELRTALKVLQPIHTFEAQNEDELYNGIRGIDWSQYMKVTDTLAIDAVASGVVFKHSKYLALLTKDAIVDQFRDRDPVGRRPSVNTVAPTLRINVNAHHSRIIVLLDSSGDSLHRRNYRRDTVEAPLNEVLAAGMILHTGWKGDTHFLDPMCGSGTLPIEAALLARQIPPQFKREHFGFFKWPDFNNKLWKEVKSAADGKIKALECDIFAYDIDARARNSTSVNLMAADLDADIKVDKMAFEKLKAPHSSGTMVMNPPYDERLELEDTHKFYKEIGDRLKKEWTGWSAWIISSNRDALKHVGLRTSRKINLFNGALECSFQNFRLYEGSLTDSE
ncbi:MAG: class I SAM-dependent RNA methyltransferase [Lewinellaceae bacterium]|nr:class I SAM-dependent RNA methyltransferase [Saprospiraceae bacterium]MCB9343876.1 class I SAM-dependent RNA methyltransferase [Lewinellaceae bacterium]